ncbi:hypothetical protein [Streptomyces sp. A5-4]|uniref:hypothetical protein n=1 Tax=Streptomyces sp. A5-4 TaxID=3384771 RepID=UPI003DA96165
MKRLSGYPTSTTPFNGIMPNKDSRVTATSRSGPGWSWMAVFSPWSGSGPSARFRWEVFPEPQGARTDLQQLLDEGDVAPRNGNAAKALRNSGVSDGQQLILVCDDWAFVVYSVGPGESGALAGTRFYNEWVAMMQENPSTRLNIQGEVMDGQPMLMWP